MRPSESYFKLCGETARTRFIKLARLFAQGRVLGVAPGLDLPAVAAAIADDEVDQVSHWSDSGALAPVPDEQARSWIEGDAEVWAVVVAPYVLVQPVTAPH